MKPKLTPIIDACIENGFAIGWRAAHKLSDNPTEASIREHVREAIWDELYEAFEFEEPML